MVNRSGKRRHIGGKKKKNRIIPKDAEKVFGKNPTSILENPYKCKLLRM